MYGVQNLWPHLSEELGMDVEYYQHGNLRLGKTEEHLDILRGLTATAVSLGLDVKMINGEEVRDICPYLSDEVIGASWCQSDGHANPLLSTLAFHKKARQLGVNFLTEQNVLSIKMVAGRARKVVTSTGEFEAEKIVLAAGYESRAISQTVGVDVVPYEAQDQVYLDIKSGRLDGTVADFVEVNGGFLSKPEGKDFGLVGPELYTEKYFGTGIGIGLRKGDAALKKDLNAAIKAIRSNGTYAKINDKYFKFDVYGK